MNITEEQAEEAIECLKNRVTCTINKPRQIAIKALNKQMPKALLKVGKANCCPSCCNLINMRDEIIYCKRCGQKLCVEITESI